MKNLLILHGWGSSSKSWGQVKELLETQGNKVFILDLPGFGENPPPQKPWSIDNYVNWIKEYSQNKPFFLLGHSFGGRIAIKFAARYPEKVQGLILCGAAGITKRKTAKVFLFLVLSRFGRFLTALPFLTKFQPHLQKVLYFFAGQRDYFLAQGTMKETFKKVISEDLKPYLKTIKAPTLIVWGKKDQITPLKDAYLIKKEITNSTLEIIPEAGHAINLQSPEKLSEIILGWLNKF